MVCFYNCIKLLSIFIPFFENDYFFTIKPRYPEVIYNLIELYVILGNNLNKWKLT